MDLEYLDNQPEGKNESDLLEGYEAEILSIALGNNEAVFDITSKLEVIDFSSERHQIIFSAILDLANEGAHVKGSTVIAKLEEKKQLNKFDVPAYIGELVSSYHNDEGMEETIAYIFKHSLARRLDRVLAELNTLRRSNTGTIDELVLKAQEKILNIKTDVSKDDAEKIDGIVDRVITNTYKLMDAKTLITGVPTGFEDVDNLTSGWQNGDFVILAARPSMGKTAYALNLAVNSAVKGKNVAIFSLEMPKEQLVQRVLSSEAYIDSKKIRTGQGITDDEKSALSLKADQIRNYNIVIDDTPGINILQLQAKLRKLKRDFDIDICFIDYLQLISGIPNRNENRQNEVSTISRQIKKIARELNLPIICLSQLSRSVESRPKEERRPIMSDLRDSGAIEQDADIVMFLYRAEYYSHAAEDENKAELIFAKHRNGATGTIELNFAKDYGRFSDKI